MQQVVITESLIRFVFRDGSVYDAPAAMLKKMLEEVKDTAIVIPFSKEEKD